ncbi:hypothetical protein KJ980_00730 [Patescibacteria group bacterium]|nr:hypothetical protein [Patescibacteria group bacterium]MBU4016687.1 hypothetical protein [Patescibacteria group bacterium]MBU4098154.1 hypothetical protein [Patescibacteria group bacterium]
MEVALISKNSLKIKGRHASFGVDDSDKSIYNGVIFLNKIPEQLNLENDTVAINGPGEYESGGVKITGSRNDGEMFYNLNMDGVEILLGKLSVLEKQQHKLKDQHIVVVYVDFITNASFVTSLASSVVIFYGEQASALVEKLGKENIKAVQKYTAISGKLPVEVETVILEEQISNF